MRDFLLKNKDKFPDRVQRRLFKEKGSRRRDKPETPKSLKRSRVLRNG